MEQPITFQPIDGVSLGLADQSENSVLCGRWTAARHLPVSEVQRWRDGTSSSALTCSGWRHSAAHLPGGAQPEADGARPEPEPGTAMARRGSRRNIRLDSFLKRNTEPAVYEGIGACEPCVVVSESVNKVYMHAVLGDERVYLTEYPPRTLATAFTFGRVREIELVSFFCVFFYFIIIIIEKVIRTYVIVLKS